MRIRSVLLDSIKPLYSRKGSLGIPAQAKRTCALLSKLGLTGIGVVVNADKSKVTLHLPEGCGSIDAIHLRAILVLAFAGISSSNGGCLAWSTVLAGARRSPVLPPVKRNKYKLRLEINSSLGLGHLLDTVAERLHHDAVGGRLEIFLD